MMKPKGKHRGGHSNNGGQPNQWVNGHAAHVRVRRVRCGKQCGSCPHGPYEYLVWRDNDGRVHERYVGKAAND